MNPGAPHPGGLPPRTADQRLREMGLTLIMRFGAVNRIGRAYQVGNAVFNTQMDHLHVALRSLFDECEEVVLVALETDLYVNGFRIPIRAQNVRFHRALIDEFKRRAIAGVRFERGLERPELEKFFELFMQPDIYFGTSLLEACLIAGLDHVQPAIHASTHAPDAPFESLDTGWRAPDPEAPRVDGPDSGNFAEAGRDDDTPAAGKAPRGAARKSYWVAMAGTRSLFAPTTLHREIEMRNAKRVVQPLVDGAFDAEPVVVGLGTLGHHDEFTYAHAVNVTQVAVTMGHALGLDRRGLADLGVAALLHDVGKNAVADRILHPVEEFTAEERAAVESHPVEGAKLLARTTSLNPTTLRCMRVSLEHHMTPSGKGYPRLAGWHPGVLAQIVSVADCYVCLQTYRSRHGANVTPYQALGMVLGPLRSSFEPAVLWALVQAVGLYPPGQLVELDDQRIALVLSPNPADLERPSVRVVARTDRRRLTAEERVEHKPLPASLRIVRALKAEDYPEDPEADDAPAAGAA